MAQLERSTGGPEPAIRDLQIRLDELLSGTGPLRVLEAGCGAASRVDLGQQVYVVGIDVEARQLDRNDGLDEKIVADIQTHQLLDASYDIIVCWNVLEHIKSPSQALESFQAAVKPGGLVIIAVPNPNSIKGWVTRLTPHWVHVLVFRHVYGSPTAGLPGYGPFRTIMDRSIAPKALRAQFEAQGFTEEYSRLYPSRIITRLKQRSLLAYVSYRAALFLSKVVTFGRYDGNNSDVIAVFRRPQLSGPNLVS